MLIGQVFPQEREIELNAGKKTIQIEVTNAGDRPVQVGSHFHFFETNKMLSFDRAAAFGYRLDVPSGNAVRFEPGETKRSYGLNNLSNCQTSEANKATAVQVATLKGFIK